MKKKKIGFLFLFKNEIIFLFILKIIFLFLFLFFLYGFFLYHKITNRLGGDVWDLPAIIYSRIMDFEPGINFSKNKTIRLLEELEYKKVNKIHFPGEYIVRRHSIDIFRRSFDFPDQKEKEVLARFNFKKNKIKNIINVKNGNLFSFFRLDPKLIFMMESNKNEKRFFLRINEFPNFFIKILLETEDRYFYKHDGVHFYSICRAIIANVIAGKTIQGGSTLTQQLVKNLFLDNKKTFIRKINEIYMAILMDFFYSKNRILELYLNEVYLGQDGDNKIHGFPLASLYYFGRPIHEITVDQQALLIGMVKGASFYNPLKNYKSAFFRRNTILSLLKKRRIISSNFYNFLVSRPLGVKYKKTILNPRPAFQQFIKEELENKIGNNILNLSGARIFSTLDPVLQKIAENSVVNGILGLRKKYNIPDLEVAMIVVDRFNGEVRAIVGGSKPEYSGFNRALKSRRPIGSLSKPSTYLSALSEPERFGLNTLISDIPVDIRFDNKTWKPKNFDNIFRGKVMLVDALISSLNIPTVNIGLSVGLNKVVEILIKLGVPVNIIQKVPSILLGSLNLTLIEVAQIFQTISGGGNKALLSGLRSVISNNNKKIYNTYPSSKQVVSPQAAYLTLYAMQQSVKYGTSRMLMKKFSKYNLAGKTGTSNNFRDSWFVGIDGKEVTIIWVGKDNNGSTNLTGSSGALYIYEVYLENKIPSILNNIPPKEIINMKVDIDGNLKCSNKDYRVLPIWVKNSDFLCNNF